MWKSRFGLRGGPTGVTPGPIVGAGDVGSGDDETRRGQGTVTWTYETRVELEVEAGGVVRGEQENPGRGSFEERVEGWSP